MINQLISTRATYSYGEQAYTRLLALPDVRMGNVIGSPPEQFLTLIAKQAVKNHFEEPAAFAPIVNGLVNKVFIAQSLQGLVVIKIRPKGESDREYHQAKWATDLATAHNIPAPAVLAIGKYKGHPYMISTYMSGIPGNIYQGDSSYIWFQLGIFARRINAIPTRGQNNLDVYLIELSPIFTRSYQTKCQILNKSSFAKLLQTTARLKNINFDPHLVHKDLVPRNVKVDKKGKVVAILDWDHAASHIVPSFEFALALEDSSNRQKGLLSFMQGYGLSKQSFIKLEQQIIDLCLMEYLVRLRIKIDKGDYTGSYIDEQKIMEFLNLSHF